MSGNPDSALPPSSGSGSGPSRPSHDASHDASHDPALDPAVKAQIAESLTTHVPHNRALGLRFVEYRDGRVTVGLPYDERLVGNPLTRVLHGGAITALMDTTCGTAVFMKLLAPIPIATLDLRIDYLKPATPDREVYARAECFRVTRNVAFVRCEAFHPGADEDLVAVANGTFIVTRDRTLSGRKRTPK